MIGWPYRNRSRNRIRTEPSSTSTGNVRTEAVFWPTSSATS